MRVLMVFTLLLVAIATTLSLAHALELPGKMRLKEATYKAVQTIYYPGFTIAVLPKSEESSRSPSCSI
jgi:hypothetical protein